MLRGALHTLYARYTRVRARVRVRVSSRSVKTESERVAYRFRNERITSSYLSFVRRGHMQRWRGYAFTATRVLQLIFIPLENGVARWQFDRAHVAPG